MTLTIGVDIGGTKVAAGVVDEDGTVLATVRRRSPAGDPAEMRAAVVAAIGELTGAYPVTAVGIGAAGWIDPARSKVLFAPNIAWRDEPLGEYVSDATGLPVIVENDANAAAWAEFRFGAGRDADDSMVMITVGTGIGGGIILAGELLRGAHGTAAEFGHVLAVGGGHRCGCGREGCIEQYASGRALIRFAVEGARRAPEQAVTLLRQAGGEVSAITGQMVTAAAFAGDPVAVEAFAEAGHWLGTSLADLTQIFDPQVLVLGGGVVEAGEVLLGPVRRAYLEALARRTRLPVATVRPAMLGNAAGVVGAADLARRR
ncbi:MAG TPA: ROK family glucokinase [Micromonosporaceae bacterium]